MIYHGSKKLFGWFGGNGLEASTAFFAKQGLEPALQLVLLAGGAQVVGGIAFILGFATRFWGAVIAFTMGVAVYTVHDWQSWGDSEKPMLILLGSLTLMLAGAGRLSVDYNSQKV